ncbi:AvrD family protein [Streptomyces anthocyanicus]|uniref:AvrD family protein n=1 Tax=Streptomyces anthocyanicus TaxID=68174 RepID=UPI002DDA331B|nr:AvrD family protein [Streptomyces anthocyanicus]WSB66347.1 AvrD family protein [Streptomyces anthocyanicus]
MPVSGSLSQKLFHRSVDDVLGPRERRFFGEGFKRAEHRLRHIFVTYGPEGRAQADARVSVDYPSDWSRKGDADQRPHLSTVDVLVIGAQLSEVHLAHVLGLSPDQRARAVLQRVRIKAGRSPVEEDLAGFAAGAQLVATVPSDRVVGLFLSTVDCVVGTLRMRCEIRHEAGVPHQAAGSYDSLRGLLGDPRLRLFGEGFTSRKQLVEDVVIDPQARQAAAAVRVIRDEDAPSPATGLEGAHHDRASAIDAFVIGLQLGQVLLYTLDDVPRAQSNTLWMRETILELDPLRPPLPATAPVTTRLDRCKRLETGKGDIWRSADIVGEFLGVRLRCSVAHRLP